MEGLRPLNVGELLDSAIRIYRSRWKTLLAAVAVPVIPVVVLSALVSWSAQPGFSLDPSTGQINADGGDLALTLVATFVSILAIFVATSVATAACFRSLSGAYVGDDATWRESLRFGFSRLGSVVGLTILNAFALVVGFFACVVGIFWVLAFFSVAMPVLLVEGQGVFDSFGRSRALVRGSGWRVLGIVLLSAILASIFQAVLSAPLGFLVFTDAGPLTTQLISVPTQVLATILVTPFTAALTMALYVDLRVRKEGFDLALWAQRLGAPGPSATAGVPYPSDGGYSFPPVPQAPSPGNAPFPLAVPPPPPPPTPPPPPPPSPPPPPPPSQGSPGGAWTPPPTTDWSPPPGDG